MPWGGGVGPWQCMSSCFKLDFAKFYVVFLPFGNAQAGVPYVYVCTYMGYP